MTCLASALCTFLDISGTTVTIGPTDHPVAVAEVWMHNENTNGAHDERTFTMSYDGLTFEITFEWERGIFGEDAIIVAPPPGYTCEPDTCEVVVMESFSKVIYIVPYLGM